MVALLPSRLLLDYIFSCGFDHLAHLEPTNDEILDSMTTLQVQIQKHPLEWRHMCSKLASLYHPWITPEHDFIICVLISMFPEPFLHAFLNHSPSKTKYHSNPLVHTVHLDKIDHARTLLLHGVDVNGSGWDVDGLDSRLPLEVALHRENSALVDLFLKEGSATIPRQVYSTVFDGSHCDYPPHLVSILLQADEFAEWTAEAKGAVSPLRALNQDRYRQHRVTEKDLLVMIRRLVQIGHDLSCSASSVQFLLMVRSAALEGHLSLLEYLFCINTPIPSGILFAEKTAPLVLDLTHRGVDIKAVVAKGDIMLHRVLRRCFEGSSCWTLDCERCSKLRSTLLTALGRKVSSFTDF